MRALLLLVLAFGRLLPLGAHELGAATVHLRIGADRQAAVRVDVDPEHLPLALNPFVGLDPSAPDSERRARAEAFMRSFMAHLRLDGGGRALHATAALEPLSPDLTQRRFAFRFAFELPPGARALIWKEELPLGQYFFTVGREGRGNELKLWMEGAKAREVPLDPAPPKAGLGALSLSYLRLGFTHILPGGLDHILFVLGIFLLSLKWRPILWQVTAFTLAHSITLGLSLYGLVSLRPAIVEPLIALSIVAVAVENVWTREFHWRRVAVVFAFGLLHGLGFAGALHDLGLQRGDFLTALLGFNAGVELGQLSVVALAFAALGLPFGRRDWYRPRVAVPASVLIAAVGLYWTVQRVFFA